MKSIKSAFWGGLLLAVFLGITFFLLAQLWNAAVWISSVAGFRFLQSELLNTLIYLGFVVVALCLLGWSIKVKFLRKGVDIVFGKIPILSWLIKLVPKGNDVDFLTSSDSKKEAILEFLPGIWVRGFITKSWEKEGKKYCTFYFAGSPAPVTGFAIDLDLSKVKIEYSGRSIADYFVYVITYGIRSSAD